MKRLAVSLLATFLPVGGTGGLPTTGPGARMADAQPLGAIVHWSLEAQRAIVPPPAGVGQTFPGEAAVYMGIVHVAMYDAAVAVQGSDRRYAVTVVAPADAAAAAAIAAAAHGVLVGLLPQQQPHLDRRYTAYLSRLPDDVATTQGIRVGEQVAAAIMAVRSDDGRQAEPEYVQQPSGPGVFEPDPTRPVLGLRLSRIRPLALESPWQFRPAGPTALTSQEYAADFETVKRLGRFDSASRTGEQTSAALFWTDHDLRQWNEGLLRLAVDRGLDFVQAARMLALAHVSGGDAMIACFDAKYHYRFWRPASAVAQAALDGNPATEPDATWRPLRATPNFPEYPSAHACHSGAVVEALAAFFGTDEVGLSLDSHATGTTRGFAHLEEIVTDVEEARVFVGFHFPNSDREGSTLGRKVARFAVARFLGSHD